MGKNKTDRNLSKNISSVYSDCFWILGGGFLEELFLPRGSNQAVLRAEHNGHTQTGRSPLVLNSSLLCVQEVVTHFI